MLLELWRILRLASGMVIPGPDPGSMHGWQPDYSKRLLQHQLVFDFWPSKFLLVVLMHACLFPGLKIMLISLLFMNYQYNKKTTLNVAAFLSSTTIILHNH